MDESELSVAGTQRLDADAYRVGDGTLTALEQPATRRSVLVTGASKGIGRAAALGLVARGYRVYAGVRRDSDARCARTASANSDP